MRRAYPQGHFDANHYWIVPTSPGTAYEFGIERNRSVHEMAVMSTNQDCFD